MQLLASVLYFLPLVEATFRIPRVLPSKLPGPSSSSLFPRDDDLSRPGKSCRYLPGDSAWPSQEKWQALNRTLGGKLIRGVPMADVCYQAALDATACSNLQAVWSITDPYLNDPVNTMSPYWQNNSCSPYLGASGACTLGNMAQYAIDVSSASDIATGIKFASENNIRLTVKNTGHDLLGRSSGQGSLALWTHHMKDVTFLKSYSSPKYSGPAAKVGAGVQVHDVYTAASAAGYRLVGGGCPTVGLAGGWLSGGGHGPLTAAYGLGADEALEYEVVTAKGTHLVATPTQNSDLYWALSGGGAGNYAVIVSLTLKAHADGPVAGSAWLFTNTDNDAYWAAITAWLKHLFVLDSQYPTLKTAVTLTNEFFYLDFATFPDATVQKLNEALNPFLQQLQALNLTLSFNKTVESPSFAAHYNDFSGTAPWGVNQTVNSRLIPRSLIEKNVNGFVDTLQSISNSSNGAAVFVFVAANVTHEHVGNAPGSNSVLPAWRDALFLLNYGVELAPDATWDVVKDKQALVNQWGDTFRELTPGGGSYLNEATWNDAQWKVDYFGANYDRLAQIKAKYDPEYLLWVEAGVGNDVTWEAAQDGSGRLCKRH